MKWNAIGLFFLLFPVFAFSQSNSHSAAASNTRSQSGSIENSLLSNFVLLSKTDEEFDVFSCDPNKQLKLAYVPLPTFDAPNYYTYSVYSSSPDEHNELQSTPQEWPVKIQVDAAGAKIVYKDYETINTLLPNISTEISINKTDASGDVGGFFPQNITTNTLPLIL